jgi:multidrug efflux pump
MGVVIVGGTIFSLILTLFVIPGIYAMWSKDRKRHPEFDRIKEFEQEEVSAH